MDPERIVPPRIFRITFTTGSGVRYWRYIKCPYQVRSPEDWADSLEGVQTNLAGLVLEGRVQRFTLSVVPADNINPNVRSRLVRWSEVKSQLGLGVAA